MTIDSKGSGFIEVHGVIKSINDSQLLIDTINSVKYYGTIYLTIFDSFVITSSVIGYLIKLVEDDKIEVHLEIGNDTLYQLLNDLGLTQLFHVRLH